MYYYIVTSWQGVTRAGIKEGEWMAIVGCGGLGHLGKNSSYSQSQPLLMKLRNSICQKVGI